MSWESKLIEEVATLRKEMNEAEERISMLMKAVTILIFKIEILEKEATK